MGNGAKRDRIEWIDAAKGLGIILVVVGHTIRGLVSSEHLNESTPIQALDTWIYSFHMPLFFFLSGLFIARSAEKNSFPHFVWDKSATIAYPYFVWSIITILLKTALGSLPTTPRTLHDLPLIFYQPVEQYWFLYALFVFTIFYRILYPVGNNSWVFLAIAIIIHPDVTRLWINSSAVADIKQFAIFFAVGCVIGSNRLREISATNAGALAFAAVAGLSVAAGRIFVANDKVSPLFAFSGICGACALAMLLSRSRVGWMFEFVGCFSLEIFVIHTMASAGTRILLEHLHLYSVSIHVFAGIISGLLAPIAIAVGLDRLGIRHAFLLGKFRPNVTLLSRTP